MNNCIIKNIVAQITNYECDAVKVIKIIKTDIIDNMFTNVENIDELSVI